MDGLKVMDWGLVSNACTFCYGRRRHYLVARKGLVAAWICLPCARRIGKAAEGKR